MENNTLDIPRRGINTLNILGILQIKLLIGLDRLKCGKSGCRGYMNDDNFEFRFQTENRLKEVTSKEVMQVDKLPWHELLAGDLSSEDEAVKAELRTYFKKLVPVNGRFVLLFKSKCGCPYAKIEAWSSEDSSRRHATASTNEGIVSAGIEARIKSGEDAICYICKEKYKNIFEIKQLPCSHFFHQECIDKSLKMDGICPLCDEWDDSWDERWIEDWDDSRDDFVLIWDLNESHMSYYYEEKALNAALIVYSPLKSASTRNPRLASKS
ncbi:hypothetical protein POM88_015879 [Heracleum sosnowskyi]|uniref:RING-type domain-containing protein n=1 Tax=Heracleum sosnowskyi TaxID=360622 RepID=A0AAD8IMS7_9APIA|nr:hypothetical protein POM88_015879 [Heracleum sosnowskyi]